MTMLSGGDYDAGRRRRDSREADGIGSEPRSNAVTTGSLSDHARRSDGRRHFLLVSGPFGPFTRRLGASLRQAGARCTRVLLNAGDLYDWGPAHARPYFGPPAGFPAWIAELVRRCRVTDIVIYGDTNPYCADAAAVAAQSGLPVHVLEQGYFRPFWITLESNGVNANSSLPRDPEFYVREASTLPDYEEVWLPPLTPPAAWKISLYHTAVLIGFPFFPRFREPYEHPIVHQGLSHARRYIDQRLFRRRHWTKLAQVLGEGARDEADPLFLGLLQRPGDSQLRLHSKFSSTAAFIEAVVASFAQHAPGTARLLFKSHPLDHGLEPHGRSAARAAAAHGVGDRIFFTDVGDLSAILPSAAGVITVNSTAGLAALERGLPTITLGNAIYDMPGLTHQGGLQAFWTRPEPPRLELYHAFRKVVIDRTQVSGAFATRKGVDIAVPQVTSRLLAKDAPGRSSPSRPMASPTAAKCASQEVGLDRRVDRP